MEMGALLFGKDYKMFSRIFEMEMGSQNGIIMPLCCVTLSASHPAVESDQNEIPLNSSASLEL